MARLPCPLLLRAASSSEGFVRAVVFICALLIDVHSFIQQLQNVQFAHLYLPSLIPLGHFSRNFSRYWCQEESTGGPCSPAPTS
jgi:hypothetical protein